MKLVIFDFDGLILDTETPDYESWQEVYAEFGVELPLSVWADCIGAPAGLFDPVDFLERLLEETVDRTEIEARRRLRFLNLVSEQPLRSGIESLMTDCADQGVSMAVASSATRDWVEGHLDRFDLRAMFDCIRCYESGLQGKPAPDLFHAVLRDLAIAPSEAIVLEDSPNGILAANCAGIYSVAVPNPVTGLLNLDHARLVIDALEEWPLERLRDHMNKGRLTEV
ncbi:MAG: HAD-IA family hydrolase [Candidatus Hydrogenedentes bacterium]|nr:HAD-IA family hydrolase [Candidatus Hydrogenedentota bacterium]